MDLSVAFASEVIKSAETHTHKKMPVSKANWHFGLTV
jgi:hypothetical protein